MTPHLLLQLILLICTSGLPERILVYLEVRAWPSGLPERILVYRNVLPPPRLLRLHLRHRAAARRLF